MRCRPAVCSALQVMRSSAAVTYQWCCKRPREEDGHGGCSGCCELHDGNRSNGLRGGVGVVCVSNATTMIERQYSMILAATAVLCFLGSYKRHHLPCSQVDHPLQTLAFSGVCTNESRQHRVLPPVSASCKRHASGWLALLEVRVADKYDVLQHSRQVQ